MFKAFLHNVYIYLNPTKAFIHKFGIQREEKISSAPIVTLLWLYNTDYKTGFQTTCLHAYQQSQG